jgi:hypothetical protein
MRNIQKIGMYGLVVGLVMGPGVASVMAMATSQSTATINWPISITGNISWSSRESLSHTVADNGLTFNDDDVTMPGWGQVTSAVAGVNMVSGYAETTGTRVYEEVAAARDGVNVYEAFADAGARRDGQFTAVTSGWVTVTATYTISQNLTTEMPGEIAEGHSTAVLYMLNESQPAVDEAGFHETVTDGEIFNDTESGMLSIELFYNAGESGYLMAEVFNIAYAAPEPSSLLILGAGLGITLRRRRR